MKYQSPKSVQIRGSPLPASPALTPELCQLINADVDVRRAASLDNVCDSSDLDTGDQLRSDQLQVAGSLLLTAPATLIPPLHGATRA